VNRRLRSYLRRRGASSEEINRAEREGWLALLTFDRMLMPGRSRYTFPEAATKAGISLDLAHRVWRALGFPDPDEDAVVFSDRDAQAMADVVQLPGDNLVPSGDGGGEFDELVQQVRVIGGSLAKIAEVQSDNVLRAVRGREASGYSDEEIAEIVSRVDFHRVEGLLAYALRLQLRAAAWRRLARGGSDDDADRFSVGFVDLVGYTALSQELDARELAALVERFEALAYDTVAQYGGRVVKTIGDEVMFVTGDPRAAARIALRLTERSSTDDLLPEARSGLGYGNVLVHEGDYYGPVVNLARRIVDLARPGTALCSDSVHDALEGDPGFTWRKLRTRRIRDFGSIALWQLQSVADTSEIPVVSG